MRKKISCFILSLVLILTLVPGSPVYADTDTELNIYAMYLKSTEKGDSVLLESNGNYLLVDMGTSAHVPAIIKQLNELGASHIDVLFSHLHKDHVGGSSKSMLTGLRKLSAAGITVDNLYLPDPSLAIRSLRNPRRYSRLDTFMKEQGCGQITYLNVGDVIKFGTTTGEVIGPLNTENIFPYQYASTSGSDVTESGSSIYTSYENNCSLAVIFTCGTTRYFTAGDCMGDEANALVEKYGSQLKCDIMKLSHHGVSSGNSSALLKNISPSYSFASNTGLNTVSSKTGHWKTYASSLRASKYGMCYLVGNQKKTIIYHIKNDKITLYKGSTISGGTKMTGWQYLYGADGTNRTHDMYYLNSDCEPLTGIQKIGKHYYYFTPGGKMDYGDYSDSGRYLGWKKYSDGKRYYTLSTNKKYAYMNKGFQTINGILYYFTSKGLRLVNRFDDSTALVKIGSNYYAVDPYGEITVNDWELIAGNSYYMGSSGKMIHDCIRKIDGFYYMFDNDGSVVCFDDTTLMDFGSFTYAIRPSGKLVTGKCIDISGKKYYFNQYGVMQKKKIIRIGNKNYYFGKNGNLICNRKLKLNGKKYRCNKNGVLKEIRKDSKKKASKSRK